MNHTVCAALVLGLQAIAMVSTAPRLHDYSIVPGVFIQSDPSTDPNAAGSIPARFGLIDDSPQRWAKFQDKLDNLNAQAVDGALYKVLFIGRHGQGYHNLAEELYGSDAWNSYWSKLDGDGNITWGPDPLLTELGISQAEVAHVAWKTEIPYGVPLPSLYSSPLSRAASTLEITFNDIMISEPPHARPLIVENFREVLGVHTCDKRKTKTYISQTYPNFDFEEGFTEEDLLWDPDVRETDAEFAVRARAALDVIFTADSSKYISITCHGGAIRNILSVIGHREYVLGTGGVIPVLVKAVPKTQ
ncbi:hypothetical protein BOTBODRAFT_130372 [Botryobasidium botryosum FD-172 SS1]|uniref:Phosphoglycerate mutase n=1 Tax=Botryobasidium botryosum (strain FD-172 SS1) TaxID=930990 RepID=A0A067MN30_BOTB1|nr:hypothetical protein BOTBODRAFT_130372 [Botryobasidium botryosum FD-172 SS1]